MSIESILSSSNFRDDLRSLKSILTPYKSWVRALIGWYCIYSATIVLLNVLVGRAVAVSLSPTSRSRALVALGVGVIFVGLVAGTANQLGERFATRVIEQLTIDLQRQVYDRKQHQGVTRLAVEPSGEAGSMIIHDVPLVAQFCVLAVSTITQTAVTLSVLVLAGLLVGIRFLALALLLALAAPLYQSFSRKLRAALLDTVDKNRQLQVILEDHLDYRGLLFARLYGYRERAHSEFVDVASVAQRAKAALRQRTAMNSSLTIALTGCLYASAIAIARIGHRSNAASLTLFLLSAPLLSRMFNDYSVVRYWISAAAALARRIPEQDAKIAGHKTSGADLQAIVVLKGVGFAFERVRGVGRPIIDDVSFEIIPGETVAVVGMVGSGKSTLASLISGLYEPTKGTIVFNTGQASASTLRPGIAHVDNHTAIFHRTVAENFLMVAPQLTVDEMVEISVAAGCHEFIRKLPLGYNTLLGERGSRLSSGQQQLLALARAATLSPRLLVLDEATTCLDIDSEQRAIRGLKERLQCSVLIVAHRMSSVKLADRILLLDGGRIVATGSHSELVETSPMYAEICRKQYV